MAAAIGFHGDDHLACRWNIHVGFFTGEDLKRKIAGLGDGVTLAITGYCNTCFRMDKKFWRRGCQRIFKKAGWVAKVMEGGSVSVAK